MRTLRATDRTNRESALDGSCNLILYIGYILYIVKSLCDINGYVFTIKKRRMGVRASHGRSRARELVPRVGTTGRVTAVQAERFIFLATINASSSRSFGTIRACCHRDHRSVDRRETSRLVHDAVRVSFTFSSLICLLLSYVRSVNSIILAQIATLRNIRRSRRRIEFVEFGRDDLLVFFFFFPFLFLFSLFFCPLFRGKEVSRE